MKLKATYCFFTLFVILSSYGVQAGSYTTKNFGCDFFATCRNVISTTKSQSVSYTSKIEKGIYDNRQSSIASDFSYSVSSTNSRSINRGGSIDLQIIRIELGSTDEYSKTETIQNTVTVPARKVGHVYVRDKITTITLTHLIREEILDNGKWKDHGKRVERSTSKTVTTEISVKTD